MEVTTEEGIEIKNYKYYLDDESKPRESNKTNSYTYEGLETSTEYRLRVQVEDIEGNIGEASIKGKTISEIEDAKRKKTIFSSKTKLADDNKKEVPIPKEFKIAEDSATDVADGVVIEDTRTATTGSQFVWIPVTDEVKYERDKSYTMAEYSEVAFDDIDYLPADLKAKATTEEKEEKEIEEETVRKAGGFYISRYEAGQKETNELVSKEGSTVCTNILQEECKEKAKTFINNSEVKSGLITGIQWDVVMHFVDGKLDENTPPRTFDVKIEDDSRHIGDNKLASGQNPADKVCNIFDLEGNCMEYVAEKVDYKGYHYIIRGGWWKGDGRGASFRMVNYVGQADESWSFRFVLYVV